jgi:cell division inhibitor SulA
MATDIPVQFELPKAFASAGDLEYVPPASHDAVTTEARRAVPPGTLVLAEQHLGAMTAQLFIENLASTPSHTDLVFGSNIVAAAALGSARLSLRGGRPVMRRHLQLPLLVDLDTEERLSEFAVAEQAREWLDIVTEESEKIYLLRKERGRVGVERSHRFGRTVGGAALWVAMLPHASIAQNGSTSDIQLAVREVAMDTLENTRQLGKTIGSNLSLAMLGGPVNNLTAHIERNAPHGAYNAFRAAQAETASLAQERTLF